MERFFEAFQPGFHSYHPFHLLETSDNRPTLRTLQEWCKYTILQLMGLQGVKRNEKKLPLPRALTHYLQTFSTNDFTELECAPFVDVFDFNFYHRALTYKVHSKFDGREYLATHGATLHDFADVSKLRERDVWINTNHDNLMMIYGVVIDELTGNIFYIMNVPQVSLEHIQVMLFSSSQQVPEVELWTLAYQLSSALIYVNSLGLYYGSFGLDNIFMVDDQIVLENELTRKSRFGEDLWARIHASSKQPNSNVKQLTSEILSPQQLSEAQSIWYLGFIISKFASTAGSPLLVPIDIPQSFLFYKRCMAFESYKIYSSKLCQLIIDTQNPDFNKKPSLTWIRDVAIDMIKELQGKLDVNGQTTPFQAKCGLLELAKRECPVRKQPCWR